MNSSLDCCSLQLISKFSSGGTATTTMVARQCQRQKILFLTTSAL